MIPKPLVSLVIGTRPEAIKLAPIIIEFRKSNEINLRVILTGQHKEMVLQVLNLFDIQADLDLEIMKKFQSLTYITSSILESLENEFSKFKPNLVIVQGDTTSALAAALAAYYQKIPIAHVEAGLRTNNLYYPFPEEANRKIISQITSLNFAPTQISADNLLASNTAGKILITGNTVVDALIIMSEKIKFLKNDYLNNLNKSFILCTIHRRENWGMNLDNIIEGIIRILDKHPDISILIPMHKNDIVRDPFLENFKSISRVILTEPLSYAELVFYLKDCIFVLTDSGGLQEEAPTFGKPVLVLRDNTERPEGIEAGTSKLIGTCPDGIFQEVNNLLTNSEIYRKMSTAINPYGDGTASVKIVEECKKFLLN
ncbi:non-hydrolyzing UDP-N-acetylglucosamine 2-epimerase [uncultured Prochlorococcus sp.]|uniref:non-hydrolyzing UDP-N-acetylglucosamine 2-epimerase n=1 Tax=uncultured Prochlorococcus sp. TaxID=159733 RepID=UPI00258395B7|nr:UDP-N-acetylglucosamine 2-epimerase (non-hydrolyzing) [uncultured Prochlorococcus sp.]